MTATRPRLAATALALALILLAAIPLSTIHTAQAWAAAPGTAAVASIASGEPGQVTVAAKKAKGAKGYQFWASTSKKFDKAARYGLASAKSSKASATLTGLPEGKRVFVKVRAYAGKSFGKWSAAKAVTVKRSTALASAKAEAAKQKKAAGAAKADAAKYKKEASAAKGELNSLKSENAALRSENASLRDENASFRSENASLRAEVARLKGESGSSSGSSAEKDPPTWEGDRLRFVIGGQQGTYYGFGQLLATHATNNAGVNIETLSSDGSKANAESIENGLAELGFCSSDILTGAHQGAYPFDGKRHESLRAVAALYDEQVQIVTCDPDIKTVADLKGKSVSIGSPNTAVYLNAVDILGAYGITERDITPTYQSFGDSAYALRDGRIDAAFIVAGTPTAAVTDLFTSRTAYLVAMDEAHAVSLAASCPYYAPSRIPAGTYPGQAEAITTVAVSACLVAGKDVPDDAVYAFVKDIFDSAKDSTTASTTHRRYKDLSVAKGASIKGVPYHPGAVKFFKEEGYTVGGSTSSLAAA